jgi:hypothetical protein
MFRDNEGRFAEHRRVGRMGNRAVRWITGGIIVACASMIGGLMLLDDWATEQMVINQAANEANGDWITEFERQFAGLAEAAELDRLDLKIRELKDAVLDDLEKCESGGRKEEDGIAVLDSNGKGSYGPYQWQRTSYMHYYEKQTGGLISGRDAIIHALQRDKARSLAEFVIFETPNGVEKDWGELLGLAWAPRARGYDQAPRSVV